MRQEHEQEFAQGLGRYTHASGKGVYAMMGGEERLIGVWHSSNDAPIIKSIENRTDYLLVTYANNLGSICLSMDE